MRNDYSMNLENWEFKLKQEDRWLPAHVPGCIHTDLWENGVIPDPFYGTNERNLQWIDKEDWEYKSVFDIPEDLFLLPQLELVFDGLDTYADIWLNGKFILSVDNMFREWRKDVKPWLKHQDNLLFIKFRSPIMEDLPKLKQLGYSLPAINDQSEVGELEDQKLSVFARKAPYHYGWDWGPRFVTSGIWRNVRLEGWSEAVISDIHIQQHEVSNQSATLTAVIQVKSDTSGQGLIELTTDNHAWSLEIALEKGEQTYELNFEMNEPKLWWCNGLGDPNLYQFHVELSKNEIPLSHKTVKTGLRTIKLITDPDAFGTSFYFELNGVPVFAKGANHIPNDSFITRVTEERYRQEIQSAAESNMNMLRVWGGGVYEADTFYNLCDEYGIMIWQDFMFACSMYPGDQPFLDSVRLEAEDNVRRLRNHPCIALWCGNNEIDMAWSHYDEASGWGWKQKYSAELREKIWQDYVALFHRILPEVIQQLAPEIAYWPSSPLCSASFDEQMHARHTSTAGDVHYWGVWHTGASFDSYRTHQARFMSEYGFQSFPEYRTVQTYASEKDMELESEVMLAHQRSGGGNQLILTYMQQYMPEAKDMESFLYMSQILQAEAIQTAIESHRSNKPFCMGSLYWQMNDCWPAASWSGIDYYGRWKALQYAVKRSFQDLRIVFEESAPGKLDVRVLSDSVVHSKGELIVEGYDFHGNLMSRIGTEVIIQQPSVNVYTALLAADLIGSVQPSKSVVIAKLLINGEEVDRNIHYWVPTKDLDLPSPVVKLTQGQDENGIWVRLESDRLAKQVWLSSESEGRFSDNYFDLLPAYPVTVRFSTDIPGSLPSKITAHSMVDYLKIERNEHSLPEGEYIDERQQSFK
ncbi:beta-mannosidase [Paenibacillus sp. CCS19]|uniref:beta-mannosidase n=1 Tax=Paenibacillus sp. CCS19 TaxID=3158387 RepID=UPI00256037EE|nr:glycoside hydrolase family 2 protein [Paenibacillus cellulosilyticus]GMK37289.1 beta-mannosidase [Paenibacillus cellulosilyticus]